MPERGGEREEGRKSRRDVVVAPSDAAKRVAPRRETCGGGRAILARGRGRERGGGYGMFRGWGGGGGRVTWGGARVVRARGEKGRGGMWKACGGIGDGLWEIEGAACEMVVSVVCVLVFVYSANCKAGLPHVWRGEVAFVASFRFQLCLFCSSAWSGLCFVSF